MVPRWRRTATLQIPEVQRFRTQLFQQLASTSAGNTHTCRTLGAMRQGLNFPVPIPLSSVVVTEILEDDIEEAIVEALSLIHI